MDQTQNPKIMGATINNGPSEVLGIWGQWLFIFRERRSTGNYFQGFWEQAHCFWDLGRPAKKRKKITLKEKLSFRLIVFFKTFWLNGRSPQDPPRIIVMFSFRANMLIWIAIGN